MPDVEITYNNSTIASLSDSGTEVLETSGTYLTDDITVQYTKGGASTTNVSFSVSDVSTYVYYVDNNGTAHAWRYNPIMPSGFSASVMSKSLVTATCASTAPSNYSNCSLITTKTGSGNTKYVCIIQAD